MPDVMSLAPNDPRVAGVLALVLRAFKYMDGRIDPPSSVHDLTLAALQKKCRDGWVLAIGQPVVACAVLTPLSHALYLGKLAVCETRRGRGDAREILDAATDIAHKHGFDRIELQTRIELVENQATFRRLGFVEVARGSHPGYDRITEVTMQKLL